MQSPPETSGPLYDPISVGNIGVLYVVATPIGNLADISERAVMSLRKADFIAAEDTRVTRKLLTHFEIKKPLLSYREHNKRTVGEKILLRIKAGESCALVTDAGTPCISDPGDDLVHLCIRNNIPIEIIPGPCAAVAGLILSGFSASRFVFEGFLPADRKKRLARLSELVHEQRTVVLYESPHKLLRTFEELYNALGDRNVSVSREITKIYEETLRFKLSEAITHFTENTPRGEFVITIESMPCATDHDDVLDKAIKLSQVLIDSGLSVRDAVKRAAHKTSCSKNDLYNAIVRLSTP